MKPLLFALLVMGVAPAPGHARLRLPLLSRVAQEQVQYYGIGAWRLRINSSSFSGDVQCRLYHSDDKVFYRENAVGFRFDGDADTLESWVRLDDAPARRWRDMLPELATQRVPITGKNLTAPTDGIVWLPLSYLGQSQNVAIQLGRKKRPKRFSMEGFGELLEAGRRLGCSPDARFLP